MYDLETGNTDVSIFNELRRLPTWDKIYLKDGTYVDGKLVMSSIKTIGDSGVVLLVKDIEFIYLNNGLDECTIKTRNMGFYSGGIERSSFKLHVTPKVDFSFISIIVLNKTLHSIQSLYDILNKDKL